MFHYCYTIIKFIVRYIFYYICLCLLKLKEKVKRHQIYAPNSIILKLKIPIVKYYLKTTVKNYYMCKTDVMLNCK